MLDANSAKHSQDYPQAFLTNSSALSLSSLAARTAISPYPALQCTVQAVAVAEDAHHSLKHVRIKIEETGEFRLLTLCDDWVETPLAPGHTLCVIGSPWTLATYYGVHLLTLTVSMRDNFIVHHPDVLLPATMVSSAFPCRRKAVISSLVSCDSTSDSTSAQSLVLGNMLHGAVQRCLSANTSASGSATWGADAIERAILEVAQSRETADSCFRGDLNTEQTVAELRSHSATLADLGNHFAASHAMPSAHGSAPASTHRPEVTRRPRITLARTRDIEEAVSSLSFGLKGKIDASMEVLLAGPPSPVSSSRSPTEAPQKSIMPLEIKTGAPTNSSAHRAQTLLYAILLADRYGVTIPGGLLLYTKTGNLLQVEGTRNELRGLVMTRNNLAHSLVSRSDNAAGSLVVLGDARDDATLHAFRTSLPQPVDKLWTCEKCIALDACTLYRKAIEENEPTEHDIQALFDFKTAHLTPLHTKFFLTWERLVCLEEAEEHTTRNATWAVPAATQERNGSCLANMKLLSPDDRLEPNVSSVKLRRLARFSRIPSHAEAALPLHMRAGDRVTVSVEPNIPALARGVVTKISTKVIEVSVDRRLDAIELPNHPSSATASDLTFRLDKEGWTGGSVRMRTNLVKLMRSAPASRRWLLLLVDLVSPTFSNDRMIRPTDVPGTVNPAQYRALQLAFAANDYALIHGMPGTGKSVLIAKLIVMLVQRGKTVLLTSYTHSAVDNVLSKLGDVPFDVLRLGDKDKIHPAVQKYGLSNLDGAAPDFKRRRLLPPVVAATVLSVEQGAFGRQGFDYCIVDEASQIPLPACLGPLLLSRKAILVGDHRQLPPLVRNEQARISGMSVSLFERLLLVHPHAIAQLNCQYRMNEDLMYLCNRLVYDGELMSASHGVLSRVLHLPLLSALPSRTPVWIKDLLNPSRKVVFVNTDNLQTQESHVGSSVRNKIEADLVHQIATALLLCGLPGVDLGILSLYQAQATLLSDLLSNRPDIDVFTVDRSQGQEKDCVLVSTVRSNSSGSLGDLPRDWKRINVALTRARSKLVVFGSRSTLQLASVFSNLFNIVDDRSWIYDVPSADPVGNPMAVA